MPKTRSAIFCVRPVLLVLCLTILCVFTAQLA